jgi:hypothetical protein
MMNCLQWILKSQHSNRHLLDCLMQYHPTHRHCFDCVDCIRCFDCVDCIRCFDCVDCIRCLRCFPLYGVSCHGLCAYTTKCALHYTLLLLLLLLFLHCRHCCLDNKSHCHCRCRCRCGCHPRVTCQHTMHHTKLDSTQCTNPYWSEGVACTNNRDKMELCSCFHDAEHGCCNDNTMPILVHVYMYTAPLESHIHAVKFASGET